MRRIAVTTAAVAALAWVVSAQAADAPAGVAPVARLVSCDTNGSDRSAVFYGRMDALPGTEHMAMRFAVLEKLGPDGSWDKVDVPALRSWHRSAPGVKTFGYKQTLDKLRSGAAYKARIQYRWTTDAGLQLDSATRDTTVCRSGFPNLAVGDIGVAPGPTPDTRSYRVTVENVGRSDALGVKVVLSVDRAVLDAITIGEVDHGDTRSVRFVGPACSKGLRVEIDPDNTVGEIDEDDNAQSFACP